MVWLRETRWTQSALLVHVHHTGWAVSDIQGTQRFEYGSRHVLHTRLLYIYLLPLRELVHDWSSCTSNEKLIWGCTNMVQSIPSLQHSTLTSDTNETQLLKVQSPEGDTASVTMACRYMYTEGEGNRRGEEGSPLADVVVLPAVKHALLGVIVEWCGESDTSW